MSGTKAQQAREIMAGVRPARAEQRKPPGATSAAAGRSFTWTSLGVPSTTGSQQRRPNARCAAVGEASEASRDADVTAAHAHAQRHGCLSARWAQTCAPRAEGHDASQIDQRKVVFRSITLITKCMRTGRNRCGCWRILYEIKVVALSCMCELGAAWLCRVSWMSTRT